MEVWTRLIDETGVAGETEGSIRCDVNGSTPVADPLATTGRALNLNGMLSPLRQEILRQAKAKPQGVDPDRIVSVVVATVLGRDDHYPDIASVLVLGAGGIAAVQGEDGHCCQ